MKIEKFEDLDIWKTSTELAKEIYILTNTRPFKTDFGFKDQLRRSVISISSNIAEGFERNNNNEFIRFLKIAKGSAGEARSQVYIAQSIHYIDKPTFDSISQKLLQLSHQIGSFINYLEKTKMAGEFNKK